jgi:hypothetical protein
MWAKLCVVGRHLTTPVLYRICSSFHCPVPCGQQLGPIHLMALPNDLMLACDSSMWLVLASRHWHHHACLRDVSIAGLCLLDWQTCLLLFTHYWSHQGMCFAECCTVLLDLTVGLETSCPYGCSSWFSMDLSKRVFKHHNIFLNS